MTTRRRDEQGAIAIMTAVLAVVLLACASLAVDVASISSERQQLHDTVDTSALSGAMLLPDGAAAQAQALAVATNNDPNSSPAIKFYCIVGSKNTPPVVDPLGIPGSCNPGSVTPYTAANYPGLRCNAKICAIPCFPSPNLQNDSCNAIEVSDDKTVPFGFAPVIGIKTGSTGTLMSVACKGGCGSPVLTPIDLAIIADRTSSMDDAGVTAVKAGVQEMLKILDPMYTQVAFGMNSISKGDASCSTKPATSNTDGSWFPVVTGGSALFKDFLVAGALNTNSPLVKGVNCMSKSSGLGTWLPAPIDAAEELLRTDSKRNPAAKKAIVYMTDGEPNEGYTSGRRPLGQRNAPVTSAAKAWGNTNPITACTNATTAASDAKNANVMMVTIAYRVSGVKCDDTNNSGPLVTEQLAAMASKVGTVASTDDGGDGPGGLPGGCSSSSPAAITSENGDGDYFFCAAQASQLASIFQTAAVSIGGGSNLVWMP